MVLMLLLISAGTFQWEKDEEEAEQESQNLSAALWSEKMKLGENPIIC